MKKEVKKLCIGTGLLALFALWTVALRFIDVGAIGPYGSSVGFATINKLVHDITGVHMWLYTVTDWLGLVPIFFIFGFSVLGLVQWFKRKSLFKVDFSILTLGVFYIAVMAAYVFFEVFVLNCRPILINGNLEASYPSSTTMLVMCVMPTAVMQFNARIVNHALKRCITLAISAFTAFMVIGRLVSGVHWFSDIIAGALLSGGLVMIYYSIHSMGDKTMSTFKKIYDVVKSIPKGKVATYGQVALLAGNPRWARVVGYALHVNPDQSTIPCHRVVNREGKVAPAFAFGGAGVQRGLLESEGIVFEPDGTIDLEKYGMEIR